MVRCFGYDNPMSAAMKGDAQVFASKMAPAKFLVFIVKDKGAPVSLEAAPKGGS
jgi:hypothetical protein